MCILVVEDNELIRMILVEELRDFGYRVEESETADQALGLLAEIDRKLSLLVTDIHMPGAADGIALAAHVREQYPDVPIIYTTGRPDALAQATQAWPPAIPGAQALCAQRHHCARGEPDRPAPLTAR